MAKSQVRFVCQQCGSIQPRWLGRCPECGEWNSLVETLLPVQKTRTSRMPSVVTSESAPQPLSAISADGFDRLSLGIGEFDRVLGGGLVPGSLVLIGGDPGIGKSTLMLQACGYVARSKHPVFYISGEESTQQIKSRAHRLGIDGEGLYILAETNLDTIIQHIQQSQPQLVVIDSIQTVYVNELDSPAGSISQVRECAARLMRLAKSQSIPILLVGHVTKTGVIAGPRVLEHTVDAVLYLEGDRFHIHRLLRCVKNRFGPASEVGVFEMQDTGMVEVTNPSQVFLAERLVPATGSAIAVTMEGTRPLLVEIQALSSTTAFGNPRRTANGIDLNRLWLLVAVLSKRVGVRLFDQDVFVNVVGGFKVSEPAADLAIACAIHSSFHDVPVVPDMAFIGEVGLSGELRTVSQIEARLRETARLGFKRCLVPQTPALRRIRVPDLEILMARTLAQALELASLR
ncbi:MAG: DNA repair protein RadA [Ardenticatenia bacterium]|nr:MAG: DNA repair protein RadA [Ardenticatenia bacterium]